MSKCIFTVHDRVYVNNYSPIYRKGLLFIIHLLYFNPTLKSFKKNMNKKMFSFILALSLGASVVVFASSKKDVSKACPDTSAQISSQNSRAALTKVNLCWSSCPKSTKCCPKKMASARSVVRGSVRDAGRMPIVYSSRGGSTISSTVQIRR